MIMLKGVYKIYKTATLDVVALKDITLNIYDGEFIAILGPSGSGKTTLLNIISGFEKPTSGEVFIDDINISKLKEKELIEFRKRKIGFVHQFFNLIPYLTASENIEFPLILLGLSREERKKRVRELLELVNMKHRANHKPHQLSGGEQQRIAIAMALSHSPSVIIADEPTGELDSENTMNIGELFKQINMKTDTTIIIATHDHLLSSYAKRIIILKDGMIYQEVDRIKSPMIISNRLEKETIRTGLLKEKQRVLKALAEAKKLFFSEKISEEEYVKRYLSLKKSLEFIEEQLTDLEKS